MASSAVPTGNVTPAPSWSERVIERHNAWSKWTVETVDSCLTVSQDTGMVKTALKVIVLFALSHIVGPLASSFKYYATKAKEGISSAARSCWNRCFSCKPKVRGDNSTGGNPVPVSKDEIKESK